MSALIEQLDAAGSSILSFIWIPILTWTIVAGIILLCLHATKRLHVQYHYHIRLSLLFALPVGLLLTYLFQLIGPVLVPNQTITEPLKFIVFQPAIEIMAESSYTSDSTSLLIHWKPLLTWIFIFGFLVLAGWYLVQYLRLHKLKKSLLLTPIQELRTVSEQNRAFARQCRSSVSIAILPKPVIPVTYGVRHPVIIVPNYLASAPEKLNMVLRHELIHIQNRDYLTHIFMVIIRSLFWFHPLVYLLHHQIVEFRELRCDNHVLSDGSISRKKYASVLLELLIFPNLSKKITINMAQESSNLKKRIEMMDHKYSRSLPLRAGTATFLLLFTGTALVMAGTDLQPVSPKDSNVGTTETETDFTNEPRTAQIMDPTELFSSDPVSVDQTSYTEENSTASDIPIPPDRPPVPATYAADIPIIDPVVFDNETSYTDLSELSLPVSAEISGAEPPKVEIRPTENENFFVFVEQMPQLIGGASSLQSELRYPELARRAGVEGRVYIQFIVTEEGKVEDPKVIQGVGGGMDEEALRAISQMEFTPGLQRGRPVRVQYSLPIVFRLSG